MKGTYIIGVYGKKTTTFVLSASITEHGLITMRNSVPIKNKQPQYKNSLYKYVPPSALIKDNLDLRFQIKVTFGKADVYISTFDLKNDEENLVQKLPNSRRTSIDEKSLLSIGPLSTPSESEIIFQRADKDYCTECLYLIGVHTHDQSA